MILMRLFRQFPRDSLFLIYLCPSSHQSQINPSHHRIVHSRCHLHLPLSISIAVSSFIRPPRLKISGRPQICSLTTLDSDSLPPLLALISLISPRRQAILQQASKGRSWSNLDQFSRPSARFRPVCCTRADDAWPRSVGRG